MAEQGFKMDNEYRQTDEYKEWVKAIRHDAPHLPLYLVENAICWHKTFPQYYKSDKQANKILKETIKPPKNAGEILLDNCVHVGELTDDILEKRREFYEKHGLSEQAEFIPKTQTTIEEVEA